jgi:hypothetical protein
MRFRKLRAEWSAYSTLDRVIVIVAIALIATPIAGLLLAVIVGLVVGLGPISLGYLVFALVIFTLELIRQAIAAEQWRFSLRTLLFATTLVAVWLGLLAWIVQLI